MRISDGSSDVCSSDLAKLAEREPQTLARWLENDLYGEIQRATAGRPKFWFIDGPPYANGDIHIGHAVNKVLKDMIVKAARLDGFDARSKERRVGKECVSTCRSRWSPSH